MSWWGRVSVVLAVSLLAAGCGAGTDETDRQVETLATAISWPRQRSAEGFARAALATQLGQQSDSFSVLEATDFDVADLSERNAYLVVRIHDDGSDVGWKEIDPVTVCYGLDFNYYGIIDTPEEVDCPEDARPITYEPAPAWTDAAAFEAALEALLIGLPGEPSRERVLNGLYGSLLEPSELVDDQQTNLGPSDPRPEVRVRDDDVAVAITAGEECLLAARVHGNVTVWRPPPPVVKCAPSFAPR